MLDFFPMLDFFTTSRFYYDVFWLIIFFLLYTDSSCFRNTLRTVSPETSLLRLHSLLTSLVANVRLPTETPTIFLPSLLSNVYGLPFIFALKTLLKHFCAFWTMFLEFNSNLAIFRWVTFHFKVRIFIFISAKTFAMILV